MKSKGPIKIHTHLVEVIAQNLCEVFANGKYADKQVEWNLKNQQAMNPESYMPTLVDVAPYLFLSTIPDWKFISNWYFNY